MQVTSAQRDDSSSKKRREWDEKLRQLRNDKINRGLNFEVKLHDLLCKFTEDYSDRVDLRWKPNIELESNELFQPDFELIVNLGADRRTYFIECQDRNRYHKDLLHKLAYVRGKQKVTTFLFVHATPISKQLTTTMTSQGITVLSFERLGEYVKELRATLDCTRELWVDQKARHYSAVDLGQSVKARHASTENLLEVRKLISAWRKSGPPFSDSMGFYSSHFRPLLESEKLEDNLDALVLLCDYAITEFSFEPGGVADYYAWKSLARELQGRFDDAESLILHAVHLVPKVARFMEQYGGFLWRTGRKTEAIEEYRRALSINEGFAFALHRPETHLKIARIYREKRDYKLAIEHIQSYINECNCRSDCRFDSESYFDLADSYVKVRNFDLARHYAKFLKEDGLLSDYYILQSLICFAEKNYAQALAEVLEGLEACPNEKTLIYNKACALSRLSRFEEALIVLEKAIQIEPENKARARQDPDFNCLRSCRNKNLSARFSKLIQP